MKSQSDDYRYIIPSKNTPHFYGLLYFHSKQPEFLKQEIYSRLILYNFGIFIANEAAEENRKKKRDGNNKYLYELDFSSALKTARKFFMRRDSGRHIDIIRLMMKYVHAVKDRFRQFQRPLRGIRSVPAPQYFLRCCCNWTDTDCGWSAPYHFSEDNSSPVS